MSYEQTKKIDIVTSGQSTLYTDINRPIDDNNDIVINSNRVVTNRTSSPKEKPLTIANIQDNEDRNDRLRQIEFNSKLRSNGKDKKKGKGKRKLIEYDYGEEDDCSDNYNQLIQPETRLNVQYIGKSSENSERASKLKIPPFVSHEYSEDVLSKKYICSLILEQFDNLNIIELFNEEANVLLQLHLFHLYIYSIVHDQDKFFLETNSGLFNPDTFMKILNNLLQVKELNHKFTPGDKMTIEKKNKQERSIDKIDVPSVILRRLDISNVS